MPSTPGKFTPKTCELVLLYVRAGNYLDVAWQAAGVTKQTGAYWIRRGRHEESGPYKEFAEKLDQALAHAEAHCVMLIMEAAKTNWTASAWMLERRWPKRWAKQTPDTLVFRGMISESAEEKMEPTAILKQRVREELKKRKAA